MVTCGASNEKKGQIKPEEIATRTVLALSRTAVPALAGIFFLSGG